MYSYPWFNVINLGKFIYGCQVIIKKDIVLFCLEIFFTFTNTVYPNEMQHYATFHRGGRCLQKYSFRGFPNTKG